jgi:serine/threonine-protein kinase
VVKIFDIGESGGHSYLVMERLTGGSLANQLLAGPLDGERVRRLAGEMLGALAAAHGGGVLHRDIKPSNILFAADGSVKVADFGLAQAIGHRPWGPSGELTETNVSVGTPAYLAPELFEGLPASPRSDLWSVGVVLYEALLGVKPFVGESPQAVGHAVRHYRPVRVDWLRPELDPALITAVHRALEKRPQRRFASATEMGAAIGMLPAGFSMPTSEQRARSRHVDTAIIAKATAPVEQESGVPGIAPAFAQLAAFDKVRPRSGKRTPLLGAALVVLALSTLCGVLIAGPLTNSARRPTVANSPTTVPITTPPLTTPSTTPPAATPTRTAVTPAKMVAPATVPVTPFGRSSAPPSPSPITPAIIHSPVIPARVPPAPSPPSANFLGKADHHSDNGGNSQGGGHGNGGGNSQ